MLGGRRDLRKWACSNRNRARPHHQLENISVQNRWNFVQNHQNHINVDGFSNISLKIPSIHLPIIVIFNFRSRATIRSPTGLRQQTQRQRKVMVEDKFKLKPIQFSGTPRDANLWRNFQKKNAAQTIAFVVKFINFQKKSHLFFI